jgi:hypothetical protein
MENKNIYLVVIRKHVGTDNEQIVRVLDEVYHTKEECYKACIVYETSKQCDYNTEAAAIEEIEESIYNTLCVFYDNNTDIVKAAYNDIL